jgi:hypothetical protein
MECKNMCRAFEVSCPNEECRFWIDYESELNCTLRTVEINDALTLRECAERLGISFVRVQQIERGALKKIRHFGEEFSN